jgi:hypothetical protein
VCHLSGGSLGLQDFVDRCFELLVDRRATAEKQRYDQ